MPKLGSKNALFGYFWPKMSYLGDFWAGIKKKNVLFEISVLEFVLLQILVQK